MSGGVGLRLCQSHYNISTLALFSCVSLLASVHLKHIHKWTNCIQSVSILLFPPLLTLVSGAYIASMWIIPWIVSSFHPHIPLSVGGIHRLNGFCENVGDGLYFLYSGGTSCYQSEETSATWKSNLCVHKHWWIEYTHLYCAFCKKHKALPVKY